VKPDVYQSQRSLLNSAPPMTAPASYSTILCHRLTIKWRDDVARRLVKEAATRQVIVFTHDIVFLLLLQKFSDEQSVGRVDQHVRKLANGAGVCEEELPWPALSVKRRIGHLNNEWQAADKLFRTAQQTASEKEASVLYGLLREAWERGLEEVLLGKVVERFRQESKPSRS